MLGSASHSKDAMDRAIRAGRGAVQMTGDGGDVEENRLTGWDAENDRWVLSHDDSQMDYGSERTKVRGRRREGFEDMRTVCSPVSKQDFAGTDLLSPQGMRAKDERRRERGNTYACWWILALILRTDRIIRT